MLTGLLPLILEDTRVAGLLDLLAVAGLYCGGWGLLAPTATGDFTPTRLGDLDFETAGDLDFDFDLGLSFLFKS